MSKAITHTPVRAIVLAVLILSSTGFTRVVGYCSMSKTDICCCGNDNSCEASPTDESLSTITVSNSCYSERTIGGLNETKAIVTTEEVSRLNLPASQADLSDVLAAEYARTETILSYHRWEHSPPRQRDIVIQTHSFLI